jgi:hypothetical protein
VVNVSNVDRTPPIEWQLYGTSALQIFMLPGSCHPWAAAIGREEPLVAKNSMTVDAAVLS